MSKPLDPLPVVTAICTGCLRGYVSVEGALDTAPPCLSCAAAVRMLTWPQDGREFARLSNRQRQNLMTMPWKQSRLVGGAR